MSSQNQEEPLLTEPKRFTIFPIVHQDIWDAYKTQQNAYWKAEEIDFSKDAVAYSFLTPDEQVFIKHILAFFAASDGIVNFNLQERFLHDIQVTEVQVAYGWQMMMESIHGEVYSQMLNNIITDKEERTHLFNAIKEIEPIKQMADWTFKWIESDESFGVRVIAFAIVEGVFFSSAFASIYWLKRYKSSTHVMVGLIKSNEFIARDEGMHTDFACLLYSKIINRVPVEKVNNIMREAVDISINFSNTIIVNKLIGMNGDLMNQYIKYVADRLLKALKYDKIYNVDNPFDFMETIGMQKKTNFFEHRPTDYQSSHNALNNAKKDKATILDDY